MDRALRVITCLLLFGILVVQILILQRMPPNLNDFKNARAEDREKIMLKQPIIGAGIIEPVRVNVENTPQVEVENIP